MGRGSITRFDGIVVVVVVVVEKVIACHEAIV
jgi:hypothetical protein